MVADYRVRIQIKDSLKKKYKSNQPSAANIAFQVAFCYHIGFGAKSDDTQRHIWLERSMRQVDDLKVEMEAVRPVRVTNERIRKLNNGSFTQVDLIHEYRTCGLNILQEAQTVYEREVTDMVQAFGSLYFIPLTLNGVIGHLLDELRKFEQSKKLRMRIRDQIATSGVSHPYYAESILNVANSHTKLGEWKEAADLQEIAIKYIEGTNRAQSWAVASIKSSLALSLSKQGRSKEAEELLVQVVKAGKRDLGQEHPDTLTSVANLASAFWNQGRWKEAEELQVQVMETQKRLLGYEHPSTMTSINNLAMTYSNQGRLFLSVHGVPPSKNQLVRSWIRELTEQNYTQPKITITLYT